MAEKFISERNLRFLLYEMNDAESLLRYPRYADHSREVFDMIIDAAMKMAKTLYRPTFVEMDRNQPEYVDGEVRVHPSVRPLMRELGDGGWIGASLSYEDGGQQLPLMFGVMVPTIIFASANYSASVYANLTSGAASMITLYCTRELQDTYLPKMLTGEWQGTMALTEPQAGSSLSDITTTAVPTDQGYYKIKGQKIFISAGDHNGADNVVHMVLARIKGAPAGVKGISLFLIPKKRVEEDGDLAFNDLNCAGIYHKLGYRGCPITQLSFGENDDCRGWLVGETNKGLAYMFTMMNGARIDVGTCASAIASAAYYASLEYAQNRPQGRRLSSKNLNDPQIPIIEHADIRRMLLFQRAVAEGGLSLLMLCSRYEDISMIATGEEQEEAHLLLDLLTPVAKTYPSEMGILSCSQGLQILGGYGFCDEFPLEQHYRDVRIHPIHEGTTGIQGQDLLGRKMTMKNGKAAKLYYREVKKTIDAAACCSDLKYYGQELEKALEKVQEVTGYLVGIALQGNTDLFLADATIYLEFFGIVTMAWQWLAQAVVARKALNDEALPEDINFYEGKIVTCRYFFTYELPKIESMAVTLMKGSSLTLDIKNEYLS